MTPFPLAIERFPTLRQSRLATFDRCALSAKFEDRYESHWSTLEQASGTIFHRVASKALALMSEKEDTSIPVDVAISILDECLRQHDVDRRCPDCPAPIVRRFQEEDGYPRIECRNGHRHSSDLVNIPFEAIKDLRWIVVKWATDNAWDIENLIDVEQRLRATLRYPDGHGGHVEREVTGQLDALFTAGDDGEGAVVLDWKSGWGIPGPSELGFDGYFQQRMYGWLVMKNYPFDWVVLRENYVRFSDEREATMHRHDMEDVELELGALVERFDRAFQEQVFPPTPGHHCQFCPRPAACPIFPGVRQEGMITDPDTADRVAREMAVADAALKQRKEAMSAYTSVNGPQEVSSHKGRRGWLHKAGKRTARPSREDMEKAVAAQRRGVPIDLDDLYVTNAQSRFGMHPITEVPDQAVDAQLMSALEASLSEASGNIMDPDRDVPRRDDHDQAA